MLKKRSTLCMLVLVAIAVLQSRMVSPASAAEPDNTLPTYDHIVVVMMENRNYSAIIGPESKAPFINSLAANGALLTNYMALAHPSQPNYFALYAGSTFGVKDNEDYQLTGPTLATLLQGAGKTFLGYAERGKSNKPSHAHNPWEAFPERKVVERDYRTFPHRNFATLPTVAFVVPGNRHNMHDNSVASGDAWLKANIDDYARWAVSNNSLLILLWDENSSKEPNQVAAIFHGAHVRPGLYDVRYDHYNMHRTLLALHGLAAPGEAASVAMIDVFETHASAAPPAER